MDQVHVIRHQVLVEGRSQRQVAKAFGISRLKQGSRLGDEMGTSRLGAIPIVSQLSADARSARDSNPQPSAP
jgi:hypothetical protein